MYSRLYTSLLVGYPWIISATAFNHCYTDSGLFGIHCSADPERTEDLLQVSQSINGDVKLTSG